MSGIGGSAEAMYWALGEDDVYVIVDAPDDVTVAAVSLAVNSAGAIAISSTPLLTAEGVDTAAEKAVDYRPPDG